jgi:hypothetical protein
MVNANGVENALPNKTPFTNSMFSEIHLLPKTSERYLLYLNKGCEADEIATLFFAGRERHRRLIRPWIKKPSEMDKIKGAELKCRIASSYNSWKCITERFDCQELSLKKI